MQWKKSKLAFLKVISFPIHLGGNAIQIQGSAQHTGKTRSYFAFHRRRRSFPPLSEHLLMGAIVSLPLLCKNRGDFISLRDASIPIPSLYSSRFFTPHVVSVLYSPNSVKEILTQIRQFRTS